MGGNINRKIHPFGGVFAKKTSHKGRKGREGHKEEGLELTTDKRVKREQRFRGLCSLSYIEISSSAFGQKSLLPLCVLCEKSY